MMLYSSQNTLPVTEDGRLVGLVTRAQLLELLNNQSPDTLVGQVMKRDVVPVWLKSEITAVQQRLNEEGLDALPVVGHGEFLLGLITRRHIAELYRRLALSPQVIPSPQSA
jgi:predicted transcriptional regulator